MNKKIIDYVLVVGHKYPWDGESRIVKEEWTLECKVKKLLNDNYTVHGSPSIYEKMPYYDNPLLMQAMVKYEDDSSEG